MKHISGYSKGTLQSDAAGSTPWPQPHDLNGRTEMWQFPPLRHFRFTLSFMRFYSYVTVTSSSPLQKHVLKLSSQGRPQCGTDAGHCSKSSRTKVFVEDGATVLQRQKQRFAEGHLNWPDVGMGKGTVSHHDATSLTGVQPTRLIPATTLEQLLCGFKHSDRLIFTGEAFPSWQCSLLSICCRYFRALFPCTWAFLIWKNETDAPMWAHVVWPLSNIGRFSQACCQMLFTLDKILIICIYTDSFYNRDEVMGWPQLLHHLDAQGNGSPFTHSDVTNSCFAPVQHTRLVSSAETCRNRVAAKVRRTHRSFGQRPTKW